MEEITLVIQGPLHHHAVNKIFEYAKLFKNIIYSCWDYDDATHEMVSLNNVKSLLDCKLKIVKSKLTCVNYHNTQNIFYQTFTTLNGLNAVETEFAIKTRCDEFYLGMDVFSKEIVRNPDFFISTNVFFRPDACCKFHASDHLIGGKTEVLRTAFYNLYRALLANRYNEPAECLITKNLLLAKGVELDYANSKEIMKSNFKIVRLRDLGEIMVRISNGNKVFHSEEELARYDTIPHINSIEEI